MESGWRYRPGFLSDAGQVRERNEDAFELYVPEPGVARTGRADAFFAVADGMGGHEAGDVASELAIRALRSGFLDSPAAGETLEAWLDAMFHRVHDRLRDAGRDEGDGRGMGSTLTVAVVDGRSLVVGHVGDSRLYRLRDGALEQLTEDHSWVAEQTRLGVLTEEEAERHSERNVLTQCLGIGVDVDVFLRRRTIRHGDRYLVSSDGLHGEVDQPTIERVLREEGRPQDAARSLMELAHGAGSPDNVTVVVFDTLRRDLAETAAQPVGEAVAASESVDGARSRWLIGGGVVVLVIGLALGVGTFVRPAGGPDPEASAAATDTTRVVPDAADAANASEPESVPDTVSTPTADTIESPEPDNPSTLDETDPSPTTPRPSTETPSTSQGGETP